MAPDTGPGDELKREYMIGEWCTNRELTSKTNKDAGLSALSNLSQQFWNFRESGSWQDSESGWMYSNYGKWQLEQPNTLILEKRGGEPVRYLATFKNEGTNLYLETEEKSFFVLSRCN